MERYLLFIRVNDDEDVAAFHPDEGSARRALAAYVETKQREQGVPHPVSDDDAIKNYFRDEGALYAITRVALSNR